MVSLTFIQGASGLVFSGYLSLHLLNTGLGALGESTYDNFQASIRQVYQHPIGETITLGAIVVHLAASAARSFQHYRSQQKSTDASPKVVARESLQKKLHRWSGYLMLLFIGGHVWGCRAGLPPQFGGLSFLLREASQRFFFIPYLPIFGAAGALHMWIGIPTALRFVGLGNVARRIKWLIVPATVITIIGVEIGVAGIGGLLFPLPSYASHPFAISTEGRH